MLMAPFEFGMGAFSRFMNAMNFMEKIHHEKAPEPHWYLMILGVDPPRQGQGVGGALMQPILSRADAENCRAIWRRTRRGTSRFTSATDSNVFEDDIPKGGPYMDEVKRPARGA